MIARTLQLAAFSLSLALGTLALSATTAGTAHAGTLTCGQVESSVAVFGEIIRAKLDERVAGLEYRISGLKKLVIHGIDSVSADSNCQITVVAHVTLKRKLRQDAHGTVTLRARVAVSSVGALVLDLAFTDIRVADVSLSHTLDIGESIYAWVANRALPNDETIRIDLS